mgnify:FL=1
MTKKRFVAILLCVTLVALAAIGATFAYLTDSKTVNNTFTMGNVAIKLDETNVNDPTGDRVTSNEYNVYPGAVVKKDPIVHNTGKNAAYIRATINVENWMNNCAAYYPEFGIAYPSAGYEQSLLLLVDALGNGWSIVGVETGKPFELGNFSAKFILKYDGTLASGADTTAMFNNVKVPAGIKNGNDFGAITVVAQAIQADGFDTWEAAFAAYDAK